MLWACIYLPSLALDGILRRRPTEGPLVLVDGPINARTIVSANEAARAAGLHVGQRLSAAQALLSQFEAIPYDRESVERWHRFLAAVAYRYSSEVSLLPHAIVLEVSKSMGLFGPWPRLESMLRADFTELGFRHRMAAAPTRSCRPCADHGFRWTSGAVDGHAAQRPATGADREEPIARECHRRRCRAWASARLGQVMALPRDGLRRRFGAELLASLDRLTGDLPSGLEPYRPPDTFDLRIELLHEVENQSALIFPVRRMVDDLAAYLAGRDGGVQRFLLRLEHREGRFTDVPVGLLASERDGAMLFEFARGRLEHVTLPEPVLALRLIARDLPAFVPAGRDLFDERPANALPIEQLRERLRARLGDRAVYRLGSTTDPRPERAQARGPHAMTVPTSRTHGPPGC